MKRILMAALAAALTLTGCAAPPSTRAKGTLTPAETPSRDLAWRPQIADRAGAKARKVAEAAASQVGRTLRYDAAYVPLAYPGGDVPIDRGVCTDVVIRALRTEGVDLQVEVHRDMSRAFSAYPRRWGLTAPDANIDHRRVPNLQTYFRRKGREVKVTMSPEDYRPGDVVAWDLGTGTLHMGLVSRQRSEDGQRFCIVHNVGAGVRIEDRLFDWRIVGHYRPL